MNLDDLTDILIEAGAKKIDVPTYQVDEPIISGKLVLNCEQSMPFYDKFSRGLCMVNLNEIFPAIPDPIYGQSRKSLDEPSPLVYFETHVSS